jgi:hypothetical protein
MTSKLDLRPKIPGARLFEFVVDGVPLLDRFPLLDFVRPKDRTSAGETEERGNIAKLLFASRLYRGSKGWQLRALDQLLLRAPPELPDGRRRLYMCGGDCECEHVACFIENRDGLFIWRDFQRGTPEHQGAETFQDGKWQWVDFGPSEADGFDLTGGPFCFEESEYRNLFQPLWDKLTNSASNT